MVGGSPVVVVVVVGGSPVVVVMGGSPVVVVVGGSLVDSHLVPCHNVKNHTIICITC